MSLNRYAAQRDANEGPIVEALEATGIMVWKLSGKDLPDLLLMRRGEWGLLEVKNPDGKDRLTIGQLDMLALAEHHEAKLAVVRTVDEALSVVSTWWSV